MCPVQNVNHVPVHSALSEVWFPYSRASSTQELSGSRCGRNRPLRRVAEDAQRLETGRSEAPSSKALLSQSSLGKSLSILNKGG
jgi:hypothetical protein